MKIGEFVSGWAEKALTRVEKREPQVGALRLRRRFVFFPEKVVRKDKKNPKETKEVIEWRIGVKQVAQVYTLKRRWKTMFYIETVKTSAYHVSPSTVRDLWFPQYIGYIKYLLLRKGKD